MKAANGPLQDRVQMTSLTYPDTHSKTMSLRLGLAIIFGVTLWRVVMLRFNTTDLFLDEAQYWFWGQNLDFGYYSKPPIIAWVIRFFNAISGSDSTFWIRVSAPLFHMLTALMLIPICRRLGFDEISGWIGAIFITLPGVTLSSTLVSTDTIQILFVAMAIWAFLGLTKRSSVLEAVALGAGLGLAFMTKYSILFMLPGVGIAMILLPSARISWRDCLIAAIVGAIVVSPNLWWNLTHDIATVRHTESIAHWSGGKGGGSPFHLIGAIEFFLAQFGVVGPLVFYAMLWGLWRMSRGQSDATERLLVWLSVPVVLLITLQALFAKAYANWAVTAYVAGTILAVWLLKDIKRGLRISFIINIVPAVLLPILTVFAADLKLPNGDLVLKRYMGRSAISRDVAGIADDAHLETIVAQDRDILADLFYTLKGKPYHIYARNLGGFPSSYYEQNFPLPTATAGNILYISTEPFTCTSGAAEMVKTWKPEFGYMRGKTLYAYRMTPTCLAPPSETASAE
jgi:4-amino-4-deoxy-L-arabinose transferase-like glycosyltransferase